ncbi:MAG TPA: hypothetical protein VJ727_05290 [Rhodanobacteraceae bacterium]|nr:hypothetical protein [Rhodanobacteraceae bacterium]
MTLPELLFEAIEEFVDVIEPPAGAAAADSPPQFCTPPWPRHAPLCDLPLQLEPSLQVAVTPPVADAPLLIDEDDMLPDASVDFFECDLCVLVDVSFAEVCIDADVPLSDQLCTPPWPRHAPLCDLPLQLVPSLQVAVTLSLDDAACTIGAHSNAPANPIASQPWIFIAVSLG